MTDFAHTTVARDNRHHKALRLRGFMILLGVDVEHGWALLLAEDGKAAAELRRRIRKAAGFDREPSRETWQAALVELERRPPVIVGEELRDRAAPCGCWPARDTGVLYEFPPTPAGPVGWPCQHQLAPPEASHLCTRGGKEPSPADLEVVAEFGRQLQRRADDEATAPPPAPPDEGEPWWS